MKMMMTIFVTSKMVMIGDTHQGLPIDGNDNEHCYIIHQANQDSYELYFQHFKNLMKAWIVLWCV